MWHDTQQFGFKVGIKIASSFKFFLYSPTFPDFWIKYWNSRIFPWFFIQISNSLSFSSPSGCATILIHDNSNKGKVNNEKCFTPHKMILLLEISENPLYHLSQIKGFSFICTEQSCFICPSWKDFLEHTSQVVEPFF